MRENLRTVAEKLKKAEAAVLAVMFCLVMWMVPVYAAEPDVPEDTTDSASEDAGTSETTEETENTVASSSESSDTEAASETVVDPPLTEEEAESSVSSSSQETDGTLTPDGNMTLVDDVEGGNREFLTVTTKDGNYFYLVIDKDDNGMGNVYFLNKVDEADLMALMDDETVSEIQAAEEQEKEQAASESASAEESTSARESASAETSDTSSGSGAEESTSNTASISADDEIRLVIYAGGVAIVGVIIAAAVHSKKKKGEQKDPDDSYDDAYEDVYDFPEEEEETGAENDESGLEDKEEK